MRFARRQDRIADRFWSELSRLYIFNDFELPLIGDKAPYEFWIRCKRTLKVLVVIKDPENVFTVKVDNCHFAWASEESVFIEHDDQFNRFSLRGLLSRIKLTLESHLSSLKDSCPSEPTRPS